MLAGAVWAVFAAYLHLQYLRGAARTAARVALVGVVLVIALAIIGPQITARRRVGVRSSLVK